MVQIKQKNKSTTIKQKNKSSTIKQKNKPTTDLDSQQQPWQCQKSFYREPFPPFSSSFSGFTQAKPRACPQTSNPILITSQPLSRSSNRDSSGSPSAETQNTFYPKLSSPNPKPYTNNETTKVPSRIHNLVVWILRYGLGLVSRIDKIISLFCKRAL